MGKRIELAAIGTLIAGIMLYATAGIALAESRVAAAERAVANVVSHQNTLNATFGDINTQLTALGAKPSFDSAQTLVLVERSLANSQLAAKTVSNDDVALRDAETQLRAESWLTKVSGNSVERAAIRVGHAREALAIARTLAADQILDTRFWQALYRTLGDLGAIGTHRDAGDLAGARSALAQMKLDAAQAAALSSSPGLPAELAALSSDLEKLAADYGRQLDAEAAENYDAATVLATGVSADLARITKYDLDTVGAQIDAYFKPALDRYNAEIRAATT